jgi:2-oxoglutarate ferredoxin oxidoreductase subunit gamma
VKQRYEVILAGSGGQGIAVSARILGVAAIIEGRNIIQTQSLLGDSQRGGLISTELVIDTEEIVFQQVECPDVILVLGDLAVKKYAEVTPNIAMLYESSLADLGDRSRVYPFPFAELAGKTGYAANMIALGAIIALTGVVSFESVATAIRQNLSKSADENIEAVRHGMKIAQEIRGAAIV